VPASPLFFPPRSREIPARVWLWCAASSSWRPSGFLSVLPLRICSDSPTRLTSSLGLRAVQFFFLGAGVDLGFAVDRICFLFRLLFCSTSCASSDLPKVKPTPESPSLLWMFVVCSFLYRCNAVYYCFDAVRMFLFRSGADVAVSLGCRCSCFDFVQLFLFDSVQLLFFHSVQFFCLYSFNLGQ
jgi:hypothetical protein